MANQPQAPLEPRTRSAGRLSQLAWQLPIASGALVVLVASGVAFASYRQMQDQLANAAGDRLRYAVRELAATLANGPTARLKAVRTAANDPSLRQLLFEKDRHRASATRVLAALQRDSPQHDGIELWDRQRRLILEVPAPADSTRVPVEYRRPPEWRTSDSTTAWISPIQHANGHLWIDLIAVVPGRAGPDGFVVRRRRLQTASRASISLITNLIGSEARFVIGHPASGWTDLSGGSDGPPVDQFSTAGSVLYRSATGHERLGLGETVAGTPWYVWVEFPAATVFAPAHRFLSDLLRAGAGVVLLGVLIGWWLSRWITRPLAELTVVAERLSEGDLAARVRTMRPGELGVLAGAFNQMAEAVSESRRTLEARVEARTTELAESVARLTVSETRFRSLAASVSDGIIIGDASGDITFVNPAGEQMFGYAPGALVGQTISGLIPAQHRAAHTLGLERFVHSGVRRAAGRVLEVSALHADGGEFPIDLTITGWEQDGTRAVAAILRDTSVRTALLAEMRQRTRELEDINKELAAFSYSVSHDLRAPLRGIRGFSQALREEYATQLGGRGLDYLGRVEAAATRMGQLIDDLLELSRVSRTDLQREPMDLTAYADRVIAELHQHAPARRVEFVRPDQLLAVGDPRLLGVVLRNLLDNAWKFTATTAHARIELGARHVDSARRYFVRDNGAGFDMRYADKLYDVFQRLHSEAEFPGTGVGLAIVQRIVHRHGGRVWGEGAVGAGALFEFTLGEATALGG